MWWVMVALADDVVLRLDWGASAAWDVVEQVDGCAARSTWHWTPAGDGHDLHTDALVVVRRCDRWPDLWAPWSVRVNAEGVAVREGGERQYNLDELVAEDAVTALERGLWTWAGQTVVAGQPWRTNAGLSSPGTGRTEVVEVERRVDVLPWCTDEGPGSVCVALQLVRASAGAPLIGPLPDGAWRTREVWVVEPSTLRPHMATREVEVDGQAPVMRRWRFIRRA